MTWTSPTPNPVDGPLTGDDRPILEAYLKYQRVILLNICAGLTAEELARRPLPSSNLSLLGLVRHLAKVERIWFRQRAAGEPVEDMYGHSPDKDADYNELDPALAEEDFEQFQDECLFADQAVGGMSFDDSFKVHGSDFSLRMVYVHMIGEYARHNGHADLLREAIDGVTGR